MVSPITKIRQRHGMSQAQLAILAGTSASAISETESGVRKPSKKLLKFLESQGYSSQMVLKEHELFVEGCQEALMAKLEYCSD